MPIYEYTCRYCKKDFVIAMSIKEAEKKPAIKCTDCKNDKVEKKFSGFSAVTSKKS